MNNESASLIKSAGILKKIKNKVMSYLNKDKSDNINLLIQQSQNIKPLLAEVYTIINKLEEAINDYDIDEYNRYIGILIPTLKNLYSRLEELGGTATTKDIKINESDIKPVETQPSREDHWSNHKRTRSKNIPEDIRNQYKGIHTLAELGATANSFKGNAIGPKGIYASWGLVSFLRNGEDPDKIMEFQNSVQPADFERLIYNELHNFQVVRTVGREINYKTGEPKPGALELIIKSPRITLPNPVDDWQIQIVFVLVDRYGQPTRKHNYVIYRQLVVWVGNKTNGLQKTFSAGEAAANESKIVE